MKFRLLAIFLAVLCGVWHSSPACAQSNDGFESLQSDSAHRALPAKVHHAEPLFIDLIRDLGARKGEAEWNVAFEMTDRLRYDRYTMLIEYEWAPIDRLGLELEIPVTLYSRSLAQNGVQPSNRIESIKAAAQWTFLVDETRALSVALGYINEIEFSDINDMSRGPIFRGNVFNPFLIVAKRWGEYFHSLLYTGPRSHLGFADGSIHTDFEVNASAHFMIHGTRNFIGLETNTLFNNHKFSTVLRPQMRVSIANNVLIGMGVSVPIDRNGDRLGTFMRLIWEPE